MQTSHYPPLSPAIAVSNTPAAIAFYQSVFGAVEIYRLVDPSNGKIGHAEISINGSLIMLADEYPAFNKSPETLGGTAVKLCLMVNNVDQVVQKAQSAGATVVRPPKDQFYGHRCAAVRDPFGHEWMISQELENVPPAEMQRRWNAMCQPSQNQG